MRSASAPEVAIETLEVAGLEPIPIRRDFLKRCRAAPNRFRVAVVTGMLRAFTLRGAARNEAFGCILAHLKPPRPAQRGRLPVGGAKSGGRRNRGPDTAR